MHKSTKIDLKKKRFIIVNYIIINS